jgi:hypothetical protein
MQDRIHNWWTAEAEGARHQLNLIQMNGSPYRSASLYCAVLFAACLLQPTDRVYVVHPAVVPLMSNPRAS